MIEEEKEKEKIAAPPQENVVESTPKGENAPEEQKLEEGQPEIPLEAQENANASMNKSLVNNSREQATPTPHEIEGESPRIAETSMYGAAMAASELAKLISGQNFTLTVLNDYVVKEVI